MKGIYARDYQESLGVNDFYRGEENEPLGDWEGTKAGYNLHYNEDRSDSLTDPLKQAMDDRQAAFTGLGVESPNLISWNYSTFDNYAKLMADDDLYSQMLEARKQAGGVNWRDGESNVDPLFRTKNLATWQSFNQIQDAMDSKPGEFETDDQVRNRIRKEKLEFSRIQQEKLARYDGWFFPMVGAAASAITDPVNMASMLAGGGGWVKGAAVLSNILRTGVTEGVIGAGAEAYIQPDVIKTKEFLGKEYGWSDAGQAVALAGAGSFVAGLAIGASASTAGQLVERLQRGRDKVDSDLKEGVIQYTDDTEAALREADAMLRVMKRTNPQSSIEKLEQEVEQYLTEQIKMNARANEPDVAFQELRWDFIQEQEVIAANALTPDEVIALASKRVEASKSARKQETDAEIDEQIRLDEEADLLEQSPHWYDETLDDGPFRVSTRKASEKKSKLKPVKKSKTKQKDIKPDNGNMEKTIADIDEKMRLHDQALVAKRKIAEAEDGILPDDQMPRLEEYNKLYQESLAYSSRSVEAEVKREIELRKMRGQEKPAVRIANETVGKMRQAEELIKKDIDNPDLPDGPNKPDVPDEPAVKFGDDEAVDAEVNIDMSRSSERIKQQMTEQFGTDIEADALLFNRVDELNKLTKAVGLKVEMTDAQGNAIGKEVSAKTLVREDQRLIETLDNIEICMRGGAK